MPGPAIALYLSWLKVDKTTLRAVSLSLYVVLYGTALLLQAVTFKISRQVWFTAAVLLPFTAIGAVVGHHTSRLVSEERFRSLVLILLAGTGFYMLFSTLL